MGISIVLVDLIQKALPPFDQRKSQKILVIGNQDCYFSYEKLLRYLTKNDVKHQIIAKEEILYTEGFKWADEAGHGIFDFGLSGFYLGGLIYNTRVLRQTDILDKLKSNFRSKREGPHVHLNIMISSRYRTRFLGKVLSGEILEPDQKRMEADNFEFNSYGNRCDQIVSFRNALFESFENSQKYLGKQYFDIEAFYSSYVKLSLQIATIMLENDKETYKGHMTNIELVMRSFLVFCIGAVEPFPEYSNYQNFITNEISYGMENLIKEISSQENSKENLIAS